MKNGKALSELIANNNVAEKTTSHQFTEVNLINSEQDNNKEIELEKEIEYAFKYEKAMMLLTGLGVENNVTEAIKLFEESSALGNSDAQYQLGIIYKNCLFFQSKEKVFKLFGAAANKNHLRAKIELAICYIEKIGTEQDLSKAQEILRGVLKERDQQKESVNAVQSDKENHDNKDKNDIAIIEFDKIDKSIQMRLLHCEILKLVQSKKINENDEIERYEESLHGIETDVAQFLLAEIYRKGCGGIKSIKRTINCLEKANVLGYPPAAAALGYYYETGTSVHKDSVKAMDLYKKAKDKGDLLGAYRYGLCLLKGIGFETREKAYQEALTLFKILESNGLEKAQYGIAKCFLNGYAVNQDINAGLAILEKMAEKEDGASCLELAKFYQSTHPEKSIQLLQTILNSNAEDNEIDSEIIQESQKFLIYLLSSKCKLIKNDEIKILNNALIASLKAEKIKTNELSQKCGAITMQLKNLETEKAKLTELYETLEKEVNTLEANTQNSNKQIKKLKKELAKSSELSQIQSKYEILNKKLVSENIAKGLLQKELETHQEQYNVELKRYQEKIRGLEAELQAEKTDKDLLQKTLKTSQMQYNLEIKQFQEKMQAQEHDIKVLNDKLSTEISILTQKLAFSDSEKTKLIFKLKISKEDYNKLLEKTKKEAKNFLREQSTLKANEKRLLNTISELKAQGKMMTSQNEELKKKTEQLAAITQELKAKIEASNVNSTQLVNKSGTTTAPQPVTVHSAPAIHSVAQPVTVQLAPTYIPQYVATQQLTTQYTATQPTLTPHHIPYFIPYTRQQYILLDGSVYTCYP